MLKKIKQLLPDLINRAVSSISSVSSGVKTIAILYIVFSALVILSYVVLFFIEYYNGKTQSEDLLPFIEILIGSSMIAFVSFIIGLSIDRDGDGVPDAIDTDTNSEEERTL